MTSIFKTPLGEFNQFVQNLHTAGLSHEDVSRINREPELAIGMIRALQQQRVPPTWYVAPMLQLERAFQANSQHSWGFVQSDFPTVPEDTSRLWLLVVNLHGNAEQEGLQRTFDAKWNIIVPPSGYTKYRDPTFRTDSDHLRLAPGQTFTPGIYWVEFEPDAYLGMSPKAALTQSTIDGVTPAGLAVIDAVWQFPDWTLDWFKNGTPAPNLMGLQFRWDEEADWSYVPYLNRRGGGRLLKLNARWAALAHRHWSSPVVRRVLN